MIKIDFYKTRFDGVNLYLTYSTENLMIQKGGTDEIYSEAIDVENNDFVYIETETPIPAEENI